MKIINIPALVSAQESGWLELARFSQKFKEHWTLIGGQLVQLHCWERGVLPYRVTTDIDTVLNVISEPEILVQVTTYLQKNEFKPAGTTPDGHQYKWLKEDAEFDLLYPDNIGSKASSRKGITGATVLETPGGRQIFDFNEKVSINFLDKTYQINRPTLWGAIFIKSKALLNANDGGKERHLEDLAVLSSLLTGDDSLEISNSKQLDAISTAVAKLGNAPEVIAKIDNSFEGIARLRMIIDA